MSMTVRRVFREGWANAFSNLWTLAVISVVAFIVLALPASWELRETDGLFNYQQDLLDRGYYTLHVSASEENGKVDAAECRNHRRLGGVITAGGASGIDDAAWWSAEGPRQTSWEVDSSLLRHLLVIRRTDEAEGQWTGEQVFVDSAVAENVSPPYEENLLVSGTVLRGRAQQRSLTSLGAGFRNTVVWPSVRSSYELCVLLVTPERRERLLFALRTAYLNTGVVSPALAGIDSERAPGLLFAQRQSRLAWIGGAALWMAVVLLYGRLRRSDVGLYRLLGADRSSVALLVFCEIVVGVGIALWVTIPAIALQWHAYPDASSTAVFGAGALSVASVAIGSVVSAAAVALSSTSSLLKE